MWVYDCTTRESNVDSFVPTKYLSVWSVERISTYTSCNVSIQQLSCCATTLLPLQWRHDERHGVSNHRRHDCLLNRLLDADKRKHQSSAPLAFVRGIHRSPVNSPHKGQWRGKCFHVMTSSWHGNRTSAMNMLTAVGIYSFEIRSTSS